MQAIGIILLIISIGTIVGPVGAVTFMYRDNLIQLVMPSEIKDLVTNSNDNITENNKVADLGQFQAPVFVDAQFDKVSRTFSVIVNYTNTFTTDLTINSITARVECIQHDYQIGNIGIGEPIFVPTGETVQITVTGSWTQAGENHFTQNHTNAATIDVNLVDLTIDVNGITIQQDEPIPINNIPLK